MTTQKPDRRRSFDQKPMPATQSGMHGRRKGVFIATAVVAVLAIAAVAVAITSAVSLEMRTSADRAALVNLNTQLRAESRAATRARATAVDDQTALAAAATSWGTSPAELKGLVSDDALAELQTAIAATALPTTKAIGTAVTSPGYTNVDRLDDSELQKGITNGRKTFAQVRASASGLHNTDLGLTQLHSAIDAAAAAAAETIPAASTTILTHNSAATNETKTAFTTRAAAAAKTLTPPTAAAYVTAYQQLTASEAAAQPCRV